MISTALVIVQASLVLHSFAKEFFARQNKSKLSLYLLIEKIQIFAAIHDFFN